MSFESKNSLEANEKDELKEVQKELKELKDIFVVCKTPADLLKVMPDKRSDKHVYQLKVNNVNYSFHGNGYVYQLNNEGLTVGIQNREIKLGGLYINGSAFDSEKMFFERKDPETDKLMPILANQYLHEFRKANPSSTLGDAWLRTRFYNLCKNQIEEEFKIRDIATDKPGRIGSFLAEKGGRKDAAEGKAAHFYDDVLYINTTGPISTFYDDFIAELSHYLNRDVRLSTGIDVGIDIMNAGFDQKATYNKQGTVEFFAHNVTQQAVNAYLLLSSGSSSAHVDTYDRVLETYYDANNEFYVLNKKYDKLNLELPELVFNQKRLCKYDIFKNTEYMRNIIIHLEKDFINNPKIPSTLKRQRIWSFLNKTLDEYMPILDAVKFMKEKYSI